MGIGSTATNIVIYNLGKVGNHLNMFIARNLYRLKGKVDYVITDAPILMGCMYAEIYANDLPRSYKDMVVDLHREILTPSLNVFLERRHKYDPNGRYQSEAEALGMDDLIKKWLRNTGPFLTATEFTYQQIEEWTKNVSN